MSLKHFTAVRDSGLLKGAAYHVAIMLAVRSNENGECWPAYARIAKEARISERAARMAVKNLEQRGLLSVDRRSRHDRKTNSYRLDLDAFEDASKSQHVASERRAHVPRGRNIPTEGNLEANKGATSSPEYIGNTKNLTSAIEPEYSLDELFDLLSECWAWKTEGAFAARAIQVGGAGISDRWFRNGRPSFVLFIDPMRSQTRRTGGLSISFSEPAEDTRLIADILRHLGFDDDAVWRWDVFIGRLTNLEMPPLEPVPLDRLKP